MGSGMNGNKTMKDRVAKWEVSVGWRDVLILSRSELGCIGKGKWEKMNEKDDSMQGVMDR